MNETKSMKIKSSRIGLLVVIGAVLQLNAQNLVSTINISLTACGDNGRPIRVTNKDVVGAATGSGAVAGMRLLLVTPVGDDNTVVGGANLGADLRITQGANTVFESDSSSFNIFQDFASVKTTGNSTTVCAINRFSLDLGDSLRFELQGFSTWKSKVNGLGSFTSNVNGNAEVQGTENLPVKGTISAANPRVVQ